MKSITRTAIAALLLGSTAVSGQNIDGPEVNWSLSMWSNPCALSAGMEAIAEEVATKTGGKFNIKVF